MLDWLLSRGWWPQDRPLRLDRFERRVRRQLRKGRGGLGALLVVKIECSFNSSWLMAGRDQRQVLDELLELVRAVAPEALVSVTDADELAVFLPDLTRGIDVAETIRRAVQKAIGADDADVDRQHWRPERGEARPIVGVAIGAVKVGGADALAQAIDAASDLVRQARLEGGNRVKWNAVT